MRDLNHEGNKNGLLISVVAGLSLSLVAMTSVQAGDKGKPRAGSINVVVDQHCSVTITSDDKDISNIVIKADDGSSTHKTEFLDGVRDYRLDGTWSDYANSSIFVKAGNNGQRGKRNRGLGEIVLPDHIPTQCVGFSAVVDFDRLNTTTFAGNEYLDLGVNFEAQMCTTCYAYPCVECSPSSGSGANYLAINSSSFGNSGNATVTASFFQPGSSVPATATDVSLFINDTEFSVAIELLDASGAVAGGCSNVFAAGCSISTVNGNAAAINIPGPISGIRLIDSGGDGHVVDDLQYTIQLP